MSIPGSDADALLASNFVASGLDAGFSSTERILAAIHHGELVSWRRDQQATPPVVDADATGLQTAEWTAVTSARAHTGLRLVAPLARHRLARRGGAELSAILAHPGYRAAARAPRETTGLASFTFDCSFASRAWTLPSARIPVIAAAEDLAVTLQRTLPVRGGLVSLHHQEPGAAAAHIVVEQVRLRGAPWTGPFLVIRFPSGGHSALPEGLEPDQLLDIEPAVFLPLGAARAEDLFSSFALLLLNGSPIDVAAWETARSFGQEPPVVVAPRAALLRPYVRFESGSDPTAYDSTPDPRPADGASGIERGPLSALYRNLYTLELEPEDLALLLRARPAAQRYTNVRLFDPDERECSARQTLLVGQTYALEVSIQAEPDGLNAGRADQPPITLQGQTGIASVWVVLTDETEGEPAVEGRLFEFDRRMACLTLPVFGDSKGNARFCFIVRPGRARLDQERRHTAPRIGIRLYHRLSLIDHLQLDLRFEHTVGELASGGADPAIRVSFKHPGDRAIGALREGTSMRALSISISRPERGAPGYRLAFVAGSRATPDQPALTGTTRVSADELDGFMAEFRDMLLESVFGLALEQVDLTAEECSGLLERLAALGRKIMTRLFDYSAGGDLFEIGSMLQDALPGRDIIQISLSEGAEDFVLPWQVLPAAPSPEHDPPVNSPDLWGYRYVIEVRRCGDGRARGRRPPRGGGAPRVIYGRFGFENEKAHRAWLEGVILLLGARLVLPVVEGADDLVEALRRWSGGDLLYVYAHGHAAAPATPLGHRHRSNTRMALERLQQRIDRNPVLAGQGLATRRELIQQLLKLTDGESDSYLRFEHSEAQLTYLLEQIAHSRVRLTEAPIVFLNTCESAQIWSSVSGSFVGFFLDRGARAVLGTETTVPIVLADAFGRAVLAGLFTGDSVGEAVRQARCQLLETHRNPLGLCYCVYGAADARLAEVTGCSG
jgi:hypothetical protein